MGAGSEWGRSSQVNQVKRLLQPSSRLSENLTAAIGMNKEEKKSGEGRVRSTTVDAEFNEKN